MKIGCQTFTWEMLGDAWKGSTDALLQAIAQGGYAGIEITDTMIGDYADKPIDFAAKLEACGFQLASFAFGSKSGFTLREEIANDLIKTERWVEFTAHFPGALVSMGSATLVSEGPRNEKYSIAADIYNKAGEIGRSAGVELAVHPSSHHNTLLFTRADYDQLFSRLDPALVGWVPDTGHILRGHTDILDTLRSYHDRISYLHLKDVDGEGQWAMLGQGICDVSAVIDIARAAPRFNGWLVLEEESATAAINPSAAVKINRDTMRSFGH